MSGLSLLTSLSRWYTRDQQALFPVHWIHCQARSVPSDHFRDNQTNWPLAFRWIWRHCLLESRTYFFHSSQSTKINLAVLRVSHSFLYDCALYTRIAQPREIFAQKDHGIFLSCSQYPRHTRFWSGSFQMQHPSVGSTCTVGFLLEILVASLWNLLQLSKFCSDLLKICKGLCLSEEVEMRLVPMCISDPDPASKLLIDTEKKNYMSHDYEHLLTTCM